MATKSKQLEMIAEKVCDCQKCETLAETRNNTVFGQGNPNASIVFLGEAPGKNEDEQGLPFVGRAGKLLNNILSSIGHKREDVYIMNILKCRPPNNRNPRKEEASNCRPFLELQLNVVNPSYIVCLGTVAAQRLLDTEESIGALRGSWHECQIRRVKAKVLCTYHPAYLLRNPAAKQDVWNDLQLLLKELEKEAA